MRVTNAPASRKRRTRMIRAAKGFRMRRSKLYRYASDAIDHGRQYAFRDRRTKKRTFRALWQIRINTLRHVVDCQCGDRRSDLQRTGQSRPECVEDQDRQDLTELRSRISEWAARAASNGRWFLFSLGRRKSPATQEG